MELNISHFSERQTKTRSEADPRNVRPIKCKAFVTPALPRERDPTVVVNIYSEKRPESMNKPDAPFYQPYYKKALIRVGLKPMQWELSKLTV